MTGDAFWLDGNAIAGLLMEVFGTEMTTARRRCASCGSRRPVGEHRAYSGAGTVLRCPVCNDLALRIAILPERHVVQLSGVWTLDVRERG